MKRETLFKRRKRRNRAKLRNISSGKLRFSVFRSNSHIYAQIIDDRVGRTLVYASSIDSSISDSISNGGNIVAAEQVGKLLAERATSAGVKEVVFDRGAYQYHGRIKALADGARQGGLSF